ncbi:MAG: ShlB/FhaC/HecB family hemolysin secretion/activation protein [Akkermansia sp.]
MKIRVPLLLSQAVMTTSRSLITAAVTVACISAFSLPSTFAQDTTDNKTKTVSPDQTKRSSRLGMPQMSGARVAYSNSLSRTLETSKKKVDSTPKPPEQVVPSPNESTLKVGGVTFIGNSIFSSKVLGDIVACDVGKKLSFGQIKAMASKVESYYHSKGYQIAKVVIPKQEMRPGGVLKIQILEGRLGQVKVSGNKRYSSKRVADTFSYFTDKDKAFTLSDIERPLVLLNSRSGISVNSTLAPGAQTGQTDVEIEVKEDPRITGSIEANNFGSVDSGEYRVIPYLTLPNITGAGDELSFFGVISPDSIDSWYWQTGYVRPIDSSGTSLNTYFGKGKNQVGNDYAILDIKGENSSWGVGASRRIIYSARTSLDLQSWFEWQDMDQKMLGFTTSQDNIRKIRIGANFDHTDSSGRTFLSFNIHQGLGELMGAMDNNDVYSSRAYAKADNQFTKAVFGLMRMQRFTPRSYGILNFTGQYSTDALVSGEQMYSGGANTVRGQPQSCYMGDSGFLINAEIRFSVLPETSRLQLAAFFDHGQTNLKRPLVGQKSWRSLSGTGVGVRSEIIKGLDVRFDVAVPVGSRCGDSCYLYGQMRYNF